ncbi:CocE/NonD family hydrolase [Sphingosinicella rhizophila]|uniref:CocE/NonD family hydrolase n=1 Tax=Sphingosinicella rhizophila TaxID=3050082 RepID=A0ABU3QAC2_9SPHN|nr:CocE/NonD family hydrolase [Sphingosinicella sp. GR2756]MDT9600356.1 CocE/NonD family hydrolase [Sphingosinicella sp. GR2756]
MKGVPAFFVGVAALAMAAAPAIAQEQVGLKYANVVADYSVEIPMKDGVAIAAKIFRPAAEGRYPAILLQTPYGKDSNGAQAASNVARGYVSVAVDVRGRYDSEGKFQPFRDAEDGAAILDWIAAQPWSNGKVVTTGASYSGHSQWALWRQRNPHHKAIVSYVAPADGFGDLSRHNGVPKLDLMFTWMMTTYDRVNHPREMEDFDWKKVMSQLPLDTLGDEAGRPVEAWRQHMRHDRLDDYWTPLQATGARPGLAIPTFSVTGWYEGQLLGSVRNHLNAVAQASGANHVLVIGPWLHSANSNRKVGELDGGPEAIIDLDKVRDQWMDHVMLGGAKPVYQNFLYFLPIRNEWRQAPAFPIPGTEFTSYRLSSGGKANGGNGDGSLATGTGKGPADSYTYDPANPIPSLSSRTAGARGGLPQGSVDHREIEKRDDILVYTSAPLSEDTEVTGPVRANIYISTNVVDTDVLVRLMDVYPDGRSLNIAEGIARAKYRDSYADPKLMTPGTVYKIPVELFPTSNLFLKGHRLRVEVTSSDFPVFARNLNTANSDSGTEMKVARTRIHHSARYPSEIILPIVPPGSSTRFQPPLKPAAP